MKLKQLAVSGYKNLVDASIEFGESAFPLTVIGNNGTGKSNLLEAVCHLCRPLL